MAKLDEKAIERLVEEVINEISVNIKNLSKADIETALGVTGKMNDFKGLAKQDADENVLDDKDIDAILNYTGFKSDRIKRLQKLARDIQAANPSAGGGSPGAGAGGSSGAGAGGRSTRRSSSRRRARRSAPTGDELQSMVKDFANQQLDIGSRKSTIVSPFGDPEMSGYATTGSIAQATGQIITPDSSTVQMFRTLDGKTFFERMKNLNDSAKRIIAKNYDGLTPQETFKISSHLAILTKLFNFGKLYDSSGAGFEFEKFIAGVLEGVQVGGENGATDALTDAASGRFLSSQKYLASTDVSQAVGGDTGIGLRAMTKGGQSVHYIYAFKDGGDPFKSPGVLRKAPKNFAAGGEKEAYRTLWIYILKVTRRSNTYTVQALGLDGNLASNKYTFDATSGKPNLWDNTTHREHPAMVLPILDATEAGEGAGALAAKLVADVENSSNALLKNLMNVQRRLQNMKMNSKEYEATKSGSSRISPTRAAVAYIQAISVDYGALKGEYKDIFDKGGDAAARVNTEFAEAKFAELDKLILEVLKNNS